LQDVDDLERLLKEPASGSRWTVTTGKTAKAELDDLPIR
jgi:hypothetical protein